jgi:putative phosphoesterase
VRRVAALYDVHGNLPALEAVLSEVDAVGVDLVVFGGDVAAGPLPAETIERLQGLERPSRFVMGNADRALVTTWDGGSAGAGEAAQALASAAPLLSRPQRDFLAGFEPHLRLTVEGLGEVLFRHGSPRSEDEIVTAATPDAVIEEMLAGVTEQVVVVGHTHMQFDRRVAGVRLVNAGSVGMPYGEPGAYWALLGPNLELRRTEYDREAAIARLRTSRWPGAESFVAENVLSAPSATEATELFERMAGRA